MEDVGSSVEESDLPGSYVTATSEEEPNLLESGLIESSPTTSESAKFPISSIGTDISVNIDIEVERWSLKKDQIINERFVIKRKINEGGFGRIYEVASANVSGYRLD